MTGSPTTFWALHATIVWVLCYFLPMMRWLGRENLITDPKYYIKKLPFYQAVKGALGISSNSGLSVVNLVTTFPLYRPNSAGSYRRRSSVTVNTVNNVFPALLSLCQSTSTKTVKPTRIEDFVRQNEHAGKTLVLKRLFDHYGSDKATAHNYNLLYDYILRNVSGQVNIFEIGLGTNHTDVVSNMGHKGQPGASLRGFRDFVPDARIYGADIDKRVLFTESRIETFHLDQTDPESFKSLGRLIPSEFDLMIDDGLHAPDANLRSLEFFLPRLKVGGWAVIEDVGKQAFPLWAVVAHMLPSRFASFILEAKGALLFVAHRFES